MPGSSQVKPGHDGSRGGAVGHDLGAIPDGRARQPPDGARDGPRAGDAGAGRGRAGFLFRLFDLPLRIVTGYPGGSEIILAMERREVDGRCGWSWTSLLSRSKALLDSKQINLTLQIALQQDKDPHLQGVPLVVNLTKDPQKQAAL